MSTQMLGALRKSIRSQTINHQLLSHFISTGSFQLIFPNFNPSCHLISCNIHKPSVSCKRWKLDSITLTPPPSMARESRQLHIDRIFESVGVIILHGSHQQTYQLLEKLHQIWFKLPRIRSEEVLGKALRRVPRHTYYIGTKVDIVLMIDMIINVVITILIVMIINVVITILIVLYFFCERWADTAPPGRPPLTSRKREFWRSLISRWNDYSCRKSEICFFVGRISIKQNIHFHKIY